MFAIVLLNRPNVDSGLFGYDFTLQQLKEKCQEQRLDLYQCFIDLKKALDIVNEEARWKILSKCGFLLLLSLKSLLV